MWVLLWLHWRYMASRSNVSPRTPHLPLPSSQSLITTEQLNDNVSINQSSAVTAAVSLMGPGKSQWLFKNFPHLSFISFQAESSDSALSASSYRFQLPLHLSVSMHLFLVLRFGLKVVDASQKIGTMLLFFSKCAFNDGLKYLCLKY